MRTLNMTLAPNGGVSFTATPIFKNEHNAIEINIDYSKVGYEDYIKRAEVVGEPTSLVFEGSGDTLAFSIDRALVGGNTLVIQAIAYKMDGVDISHEVKWAILRFPIDPSLSLAESGIIPPTQVDLLEELIDEKTSQASIYEVIGIDTADGSSTLLLNQKGEFVDIGIDSTDRANLDLLKLKLQAILEALNLD